MSIIFILTTIVTVSLATKSQSFRPNSGEAKRYSSGGFDPIRLDGCEIFRPYVDVARGSQKLKTSPSLLASPETFVNEYKNTYSELDQITTDNESTESTLDRARTTYTEFIASIVAGKAFGSAEKSVWLVLGAPKVKIRPDYNVSRREVGKDHPVLGMTMVGVKRIHNMETLLKDVFARNVSGGIVETGVWRGGLSIYAKAVVRAYDQNNRYSFLCDSFAGLPPGDAQYHPGDIGWDKTRYLEVSEKNVENNFRKLDLLDNKVVFVKGFFNNTMPILSTFLTKQNQKLSILRLDGDIYQSTVDVLYHLYDKVTVGGYIIIDDWFGYPARTACEDFFAVHKISPKIIAIDKTSVYWQKTEEVVINYGAYEKKQFKTITSAATAAT